jgi:glycine C-acetyltransferase
MSLNKLEKSLQIILDDLGEKGSLKGKEPIITDIRKPKGGKGPRYFLRGKEGKPFIRMNSNSYLGLSLNKELISQGKEATRHFGTGPGAVRFISGTFQIHRKLEQMLAHFHKRDDAIIFSSAYATVVGILAPLLSPETIVISDELNHNCIINAIRLSKPADKKIYKHLNMTDLEMEIQKSIDMAKRVIIITDGIFSMRGDYAPLPKISELSQKYQDKFSEGIIVIVDDSHGVGCFGGTGRGTEEYTGASGIDILVGTLGKAFGVNGGYAVSSQTVITYLRESAPMYIYSNPISPAEAAEACQAIAIMESDKGQIILDHLKRMTSRFETGLKEMGYEIIESDHPIVPLMVRNTKRTAELVNFLIDRGILATGLNYPVVPKGDEEIRFQVNANHTPDDIDTVLDVLKEWKNKNSI